VSIFLGGLAWTSREFLTVEPQDWWRYQLLGASGGVTTIILLFCVHFPKRTVLLMFVLPTPAWVLGVLLVVMNLFGMKTSPEGNVAFDVHLVGAVFALAYWRFGWNLGRLTPGLPASRKLFKPGPKLRIHDPDEVYSDLDRSADAVLEKVNTSGIESLNSKERKILEDYSRRMRQKHR
jgi:hypothetical protein